MKIHVMQCMFLYESITLLGFVNNATGIAADPNKVAEITKMPIPSDLRKLRSFIGMVNFYRKSVKKLSMIAKPLYDLLRDKGGKKKIWTDEHSKAFQAIKEALVSSEILIHYDPKLPVELSTDACDYAIAEVLVHITHEIINGREGRMEKPTQYTTRTLRPSEIKWSTPEKECLALMYCLSVFRPFLASRSFIYTHGFICPNIFKEYARLTEISNSTMGN